MGSTAPPSTEPLARASILHGFREAAIDQWGEEALGVLSAKLPARTRAETLEGIVLPLAWVRVACLIDWHQAVWDALAKGDEPAFLRWVDRSIDEGFGRFRRMFLKLATPQTLIQKAPTLWRSQQTHGELTVVQRGASGAIVTLRDHPMIQAPVSRRALAEVWRYVPTLAHVRDVHGSHGLEHGALVVRLTWGSVQAPPPR